ncbi:hypothetical protein UYO_0150 [Lachnospiraceae bacterium JC7]|nr:hypothetical protein UYO_0150 [Lachnospiraceae bacterium JC7]
MKKILGIISAIAMLLVSTFGCSSTVFAEPAANTETFQTSAPSADEGEFRGVWFSYLDWMEMPTEQKAFQAKTDEIMEDMVKKGMNAVFCHVHSHSDSYGKKLTTFPESKFLSTGESAPEFDALSYMIDSAHKHGLSFHAWLNPYRVTGYMKKWEDVPEGSFLKSWLDNGNVLLHDGDYYLNPSRKEVQDLLVQSVTEVVKNYPVDGVQFDDYFYPSLTEGQPFDLADYEASGSSMSLADWRRNNVSTLIHRVHDAVHEADSSAVFGVSPVPLLSSLRHEKAYYVDIDLWLRSDQYVDYILPQLYHGFEAKKGDGNASPQAFATCLSDWIELKNELHSPVKLYIGLALYKCGTDSWDGNETTEWLRYDDILAREVMYARSTGEVSGFGIFAYQNFDDEEKQKEISNLSKVFT